MNILSTILHLVHFQHNNPATPLPRSMWHYLLHNDGATIDGKLSGRIGKVVASSAHGSKVLPASFSAPNLYRCSCCFKWAAMIAWESHQSAFLALTFLSRHGTQVLGLYFHTLEFSNPGVITIHLCPAGSFFLLPTCVSLRPCGRMESANSAVSAAGGAVSKHASCQLPLKVLMELSCSCFL